MIYDLIDKLPTNAKASVLYGLVGSLNASILYSAQFIVRQCDANGDDVREELCNDFPKSRAEAENNANFGQQHDRFKELQAMVALRDDLHSRLMGERNTTDEVLPLHATLKFLTTATRSLPQEQLDELIIALGIEGLDAASIQTVYKADAEYRRAELAASSERVLSVALAIPELPDVEAESAFEALSYQKQHSLWTKVEAGLIKARNNIIVGMLNRRNVDIGDIPLITGAMSEVKTMLRNTADIRLAA